MNSDDLRNLVVPALRIITPTIWEAQSVAITSAEQRADGIGHDRFPYVRPMLIRPLMRIALDDAELPAGWRISGDSRKMGQLLVCSDEVSLRYLKERRQTRQGGVPHAGYNPARNAYWTPQLWEDAESADLTAAPSPIRLLLLWDFLSAGAEQQGFTMRVVRTTGPGKWSEQTPIDLSVPLLGDSDLIVPSEFEEVDEDTDFFADLSEEASESDASNQ